MGIHYGRLVGFIFAFCCCLAFVSVVNIAFANDVPYQYKGNGYVPKSVRHSMSDYQRMYNQYYAENGFTPDKWNRNFPRNKSLPVSYSAARVTQIAKTAAKGSAWALATYAAVEAAGWAIDELTGQITKETEPDEDNIGYNPNRAWYHVNHPNRYFPDPMTAAKTIFPNSSNYTDGGPMSGGRSIHVWYRHPTTNACSMFSGQLILQKNCPLCDWERDQIKETQTLPVSSSQYEPIIYDAIRKLPNHQIEQGFKDPQNRPVMTPELKDALDDWYEELAGRDPNLSYNRQTGTFTYTDPDTGTITDHQPEFDTSTTTGTGTESNQDPLGSDWPAFCDWATIVCDLAEFIMGDPDIPEPQEMPFENINLADVQQEFNSGLSGGSCPAPQTASFMGKTITYSFDTACYAATNFFKPVLLTLAAIMAGFIIVGATRKEA